MEIFGLGIVSIALFAGFGLLIGVLFGFFGMGGSFLVTPALLVVGYPVPVAVGSGLAFVFGTSVIGALGHRAHGQIDYKLATLMLLGMTIGVEVGMRVVFLLEKIGSVDLVISVAYVGLLALVGTFTLSDARGDRDRSDRFHFATLVQAIRLPPTVTLTGDLVVSSWLVLAVGGMIGILSGVLGVGGGFFLLPAMVYGFGVPATVAVGTDILQITVSSAYGTFVYADANAVALPAVGSLLAGSALGARIGVGATKHVGEDDVKGYFAATLFAGSLSIAAKELSDHLVIEVLDTVSIALIFGAPVLVSAVIVFTAVCSLQKEITHGTSSP
ncbi:sulfite exporter TauE/SafE family protein [Halosolutus halophilus]|uniref:sulfite exporter TauE/SafE family protein n=1 Tax=Halosolutus halophilus TaxID=1552990 RepID=UPI0022352723|nr:sulfite exporter TauE/SafE family protein [Halosolutus halophilus]